MDSITIKAPAKLNLFLHVLRKRPDDYHDIYSLFHKVRLCDELTFKKSARPGCRIKTRLRGFPRDGRNLINRAYELLRRKTGFRGGVDVRVKKKIPIASGMGGGSSDAAASLIALDRLFRLGLSSRQLQKYSLQIGADVPFFLNEAGTALVSGIGEKIKPLRVRRRFYFLIILFPKGLSTAAVYRGLGLTPQKGGVRIPLFAVRDLRFEQLRNCLKNDLMPASFVLYPLARRVYTYILKTGSAVSQTGSGPVLFTVHEKRSAALRLKKDLEKIFKLKTLITQSL